MSDLEFLVVGAILVASIVYALVRRAMERQRLAMEREITLGNVIGAIAIFDGRWDGRERREHPRLKRSFPVRAGKMP